MNKTLTPSCYGGYWMVGTITGRGGIFAHKYGGGSSISGPPHLIEGPPFADDDRLIMPKRVHIFIDGKEDIGFSDKRIPYVTHRISLIQRGITNLPNRKSTATSRLTKGTEEEKALSLQADYLKGLPLRIDLISLVPDDWKP